jgi:hypothetical protein
MDVAIGGDDASFNLRLVLMPSLPSAADLGPISYTILVFDPQHQVASLQLFAICIEPEMQLVQKDGGFVMFPRRDSLDRLPEHCWIRAEGRAIPGICGTYTGANCKDTND